MINSLYHTLILNKTVKFQNLYIMNLTIIVIIIVMQTKPDLRPSLSQILQHSFFTRPEVSTPAQLPEMALREPPVFTSIESESVSFKQHLLASHEVCDVIIKNLKNGFLYQL